MLCVCVCVVEGRMTMTVAESSEQEYLATWRVMSFLLPCNQYEIRNANARLLAGLATRPPFMFWTGSVGRFLSRLFITIITITITITITGVSLSRRVCRTACACVNRLMDLALLENAGGVVRGID